MQIGVIKARSWIFNHGPIGGGIAGVRSSLPPVPEANSSGVDVMRAKLIVVPCESKNDRR